MGFRWASQLRFVCSLFSLSLLFAVTGCPMDGTGEDGDNGADCLDQDNDGFCDDEEINGMPATDPADPNDNPDNVIDSDGDGCSDFSENNFPGFCDNDADSPPDSMPPPITSPEGTVTVSGLVLVGANAMVDGDTNDPTGVIVPNEGTATQQAPPNPAVIGGFLGNTFDKVDTSDVYRVQMAEGQTATLFLADPNANDFDLFLFDTDGMPLASSEGVGKAEVVNAPDNGTFLVEVFGFSVQNADDTGGLYTLLIGESTLGAGSIQAVSREKLSSLYDYMEGEVVLKRRDGVDTTRRAKIAADHGLELIREGDRAGGFDRMRIRAIDRRAKIGRGTIVPSNGLQRPTSPTLHTIKALRRRADIEHAEPNYIRQAMRTPNDEFFPIQWHYPLINLPEAWEVTTGSSDVIVAVIDTGVVLDHPDMQGQLVDGFDFISDSGNALDGDGIDANANDPGDQALQGLRSTFHGTHVGGTVSARTDNSEGGAGVSWDSKIMPVRVLGRMGGVDTDIAQGIRFAAGLSNNSGTVPARRADIINMSLGGQGTSAVEQSAITAARQAGVIVIVAAGNEQSNAGFFSPAGLDGVVTVSALGPNRTLAPYSNFGATIEVAAPGGDLSIDANSDSLPDGVLSSVGDDGGGLYSLQQGTSMASPHVAGVAALMKAVNPDLTPDDFDQLLAGTHPGTSVRITDDLGAAGRDESFGHGMINALTAVRAAEEIIGMSTVDTPVLTLNPRNIDFGSDGTSATVTAGNGGVGTLEITNITVDEDWLAVSPASGGAEDYTVSIDRSELADGVYSGRILFTSNGGDMAVTVQTTVGEQVQSGGNVGTVFVLLVNPETFESVAQANVMESGGYEFDLSGVAPGNYLLFGGTDMDNDSFLGDEGEAFGGYPTLLDPVELMANQSRTGLVFSSTFDINIQSPGANALRVGTSSERVMIRRIR